MFTNLLADRAFLGSMLASMIFAFVGIVAFAIVFLLVTRVLPFSVRKELEEDQNTALAVLIGSVIVGIALIIGFAIRG